MQGGKHETPECKNQRSTEGELGVRDGGGRDHQKFPVAQVVPRLSLKELFEGTGDRTLLFSTHPCLVFLGFV